MFELLSKAPSEAWVGLTGVVVGAALSLLGSWLNSKSSIKRLRIQLEHEERTQNQNIKRKRFEELYILLGHWQSAIFNNYQQLILVMEGVIDYNDYLDKIIENSEKLQYDFKRIEMIIEIYGKEIKPVYEKVIEARTKKNEIEFDHKKAYKAGELEAQRFIEPYSAAQSKLVELTKVLRGEVAEAVAHA